MKKEIKYWVDSKRNVQSQIESFLRNSMDFRMQSKKHGIFQRGNVELIYEGISKWDEINLDRTPFIHSDCFELLKKNKSKIIAALTDNNMVECANNLTESIHCLDKLVELERPKSQENESIKDEWIKQIAHFKDNDRSEVINYYALDKFIDFEYDEFNLLGSYNRETKEIKLFLDVILDWAKMIDIEPFLAFKLTFCHEMAHKYHHIGLDEVGRNWQATYGQTSIEIKEGLTQWYTMKYAQDIDYKGYVGWRESKSRKSIGAFDQFEKESDRLSLPYQYYRNWKSYTLEAIRIAMIQSRQNGVTRTIDFNSILMDHHHKSI
jgi:hypothetical protein